MQLRFTGGLTAFLCAVLGVGAGQAQASPVFWSSVGVQSQAYWFDAGYHFYSDTQGDHSGQVVGTDSVGPYTVEVGGGEGASYGMATASVMNGVLHASAAGIPSSFVGEVYSQASAVFADTITFYSESQPPGTRVPVAVSLELTYDLQPRRCAPQSTPYAVVGTGLSFGGNRQLDIWPGCFDSYWNQRGVFEFVVGQEYEFLHDLLALGAAFRPEGGDGLPFSANAGNTARFFIETFGDVSYETASGNLYPAPVPEPASLVLVAMAMTGLVAQRRRG